jgi:predicted N-formylglutamate amidohydrolase
MYLLKQLQRRLDKSAFHNIADYKLNEISKTSTFRKLLWREQQAVEIFDFRDLLGNNPNNNFLITSEHASNNLQKYYNESNNYILPEYICDEGAKDMAIDIAEKNKSFIILPNFSRLIIDPNRSLVCPTLIRESINGDEIIFNREGIIL